MRAHFLSILLLAAALGGCMDADPAGTFVPQDTSTTSKPEETAGPADNNETEEDPAPSQPAPESEPQEPATPIILDYGLLGGNETQGNTTTYYVNASAPVPVNVRFNGSLWDRRTVEGNVTWTFDLDYGQTRLAVRITTPEGALVDERVLVRLGATTLIVDYCQYHPDSPSGKRDTYSVLVDVDARPSISYYAERDRPDTFTAHDQLEAFRNQTGIPVEYSYFDGVGYAVDSIDDVGNPVSSSAPPYWLYRVNGEDAPEGITTQPIVPGDAVEWRASNLVPPCE